MQLLYKYDTIRFRGQPNKTAENERYAMKRIWEEGLRDDKRVARVGHYATINSRGEIMIGRFTYEALGRADALQLLFDRVNMSIGLKRTHSRTDNAYSLKPAGRHGAQHIRAAQAANQFGLRVNGTIRFLNPEIDEDGVLILDLRQTQPAGRRKVSGKAR